MDNNYQRLFFIFKNMDAGLGNPSGFVKLETNLNAAKLQLSLSNVYDKRDLKYQLYGISKADKLRFTHICDIPVLNGRADVRLNAEISSVGSNRLNLKDINIYAVIAMSDRENKVICPLVAYTGSALEWKPQFEKIIFNEEQTDHLSNFKEYPVADIQPETKQPEEIPPVLEEPVTTPAPEDNIENPDLPKDPEENPRIEPQAAYEAEPAGEEPSAEFTNIPAEPYAAKKSYETMQEGNSTSEQEIIDEIQELPDIDSDTPDISFTDNDESDILSSSDKGFNDFPPADTNGQVPDLRLDLDNSFEKYNPFKAKSKRYRWWKINSPGYLNNILFRNNIKTYVLFSPSVMLAHYKYKYIIFGIRTNKFIGKELLLCGVPGVYGIDENPFSSFGSWVQLEGYRPKYGSFGYWIVMIDSKTGKLVKIK